jgi:pyridoxal phosphate-dependent aminotransferase EpsN
MEGREKELMLDAFESNWITTLGPHVELFEKEMCRKLGVGHAVALSSGTAALHLAMILAGVRPGDEVLCSDLTFAASANAVVYCGAGPVFIDSDRSTWNMDPFQLEKELAECERRGRLPSAVLSVDLYGQCADYDAISGICARYGVPLVEDAAEALGASFKGRMAGGFGVMGILSFNGNKIITTSGGGMLVSDDDSLIQKARYLATQAREPAVHYQHVQIGYNYRMSNILAAIGRGQLEGLDRKIEKRKLNQDFYRRALGGLPGLEFLPEAPYGRSNAWLSVILITPSLFGRNREEVRVMLEKENIESRPVWKPMHLQPAFLECRIRGGDVSADLFDRGLCLPSGNQLGEEDLTRIAAIIQSACVSR